MWNRCPHSTVGERYDSTTIWLHWAIAALIVVLWVTGQTSDWVPRGPLRSGLRSVHVILGFAAGFLVLVRVVWRARFGRVLLPAETGVLHVIAEAMHYALYVLVAAVIVLGIADASYRGFNIFGVWSVPKFGTGDSATRHSINDWHELAANLTMLAAFLHAAAALVHQYVWRDRLLDRMMP